MKTLHITVFQFQGLSAFLAFQRFRQGADAAFATNYDTENSMPTSYPSYPGGPEMDQNYQEPPFSGSTQRGKIVHMKNQTKDP